MSPSHRQGGSLEHSSIPGTHRNQPPPPPTPLPAPCVLPTSSGKGQDPPKLPSPPTRDGAWGWEQPPFSPLCSTPTSARCRLGNQPANDVSCRADGGPDAPLPGSGLGMQMDV